MVVLNSAVKLLLYRIILFAVRFGQSTAKQLNVRNISVVKGDSKLKLVNVVFTTPEMTFHLLSCVVHNYICLNFTHLAAIVMIDWCF